MGLAETKVRRKLNQDPNNTKWLRNENTFGQKILRSHGWQPGQYLGVQDAAHSELHTAANASYIRVSLKDDTKGLGLDKALRDDEITGMDVYSDLLSRLNGKSEAAVEADQQARLVVKTHRFVEQKYGAMRFVRGGLLVGDKLKEGSTPEEDAATAKATAQPKEEKAVEPTGPEAESKKDKKSAKKRKAASLDEDDGESFAVAEDSESKKKRKKEGKRSKRRSGDSSTDDSTSSEADSKTKRKEKKSKKDKAAPEAVESSVEDEVAAATQSDILGSIKAKKSKEERKEEKRAKKERKKEKKRRKAEAKSSSSKSTSPTPETSADATTDSATPAGSGTSTPRPNPHLVRSRFLKAKREAMLDSNAINKIFMMKA